MNEEVKSSCETAELLNEQLQEAHRSRMNSNNIQGFNWNQVQFHEVLPDESYAAEQMAAQDPEPSMPDSYLNYASQLLEQLRGVYSTSWSSGNGSCGTGANWHGGHNHFYDPCSGADAAPPSYGCPNYDCSNACTGTTVIAAPPRPPHSNCSGNTATYYDDCAYQMQKLCDQLNRMEATLNDMYAAHQQLLSYFIEFINVMTTNNTAANTVNHTSC